MTLFFIGFLTALLSGTGLVSYAIVARPAFSRRTLRRLWAFSHAVEDGRASYRRHRMDRIGKPESSNAVPQGVYVDVVSALVNMKVREKKAAQAAAMAASEGHTEFEPMFKRAVEIARVA